MSDDRRRATEPIDKSKVISVYTGRHGCCCGCNGNHRYASATAEQAGERRGYPIRDEDVSDRSVSLIVNRMNRIIAEGNEPPEDIEHREDPEECQVIECDAKGFGKLYTYSTETRINIVYLY